MARAPKVTWERVEQLIHSGQGTGFGDKYRPILEIKRWNPSPISVQVRKSVPPFKRPCHFFSRSEWCLALLFAWIGAHIREQFPLWPWPHAHPDYSRKPELDSYMPWSVGMQEICRDIGIDHGEYIGTDIPYIWSIDLCVFMPWIESPSHATCLVSVKPLTSEQYLYIDPLSRGPEKLEAERRFAAQLGVSYYVADRSLFPGPLFAQLELLANAAVLPHQHPWRNTLDRFLDKHGTELQTMPIEEMHERMKGEFNASLQEATFLQHHLLWHQIVDCDISVPFRERLPPQKGGRAFKQAMRQNLERGRK